MLGSYSAIDHLQRSFEVRDPIDMLQYWIASRRSLGEALVEKSQCQPADEAARSQQQAPGSVAPATHRSRCPAVGTAAKPADCLPLYAAVRRRWEATLHRTASGLPYGSRGPVKANSICRARQSEPWTTDADPANAVLYYLYSHSIINETGKPLI